MSTLESFPRVGDQVRALHKMRAWETDHERGANGVWAPAGEVGLVLAVWHVGRKRSRMKLLIVDRIAMFSCNTLDLPRNWQVVSRQLPLSGST